MKHVKGGVCAPKGFKGEGIAAGFKKKGAKDLALIYSEKECSAAGVYTTNKVKGAPIAVTKENIANGKAQAIICNSGNANTCAPNGVEVARQTCALTGEAFGIPAQDVIVCSTGVIGQELEMTPFEAGIPRLAEEISKQEPETDEERENCALNVAGSIMTTDTMPKITAVEFNIGDSVCRIGGIAKGSGMINPNMATMLAFVTTDVSISAEMLQAALKKDIKKSFNQICVDGDTSTNDMFMVMANGMAENKKITEEGEDFEAFGKALNEVTTCIAKKMARDGEGATKLIECNVKGAPSDEIAGTISKTVISSDLFKAAMFGEDANWGRILCAVGYAPGDFSTDDVSVDMSSASGKIRVCEHSMHKQYSEEEASKILAEEEITIDIDMSEGTGAATAWGCDLTYDYVKINGDYRT